MTPAGPVVIGVGNEYRHDDGVGPAVVAALADRADLPAGTTLAVCDGEPTRLMDLWRDASLAIVVDAAAADPDGGRPPGDVLRWEAHGDPAQPSVRSEGGGSHALGPGAAFRLAEVLDRLPGRLVVVAVFGSDFEVGTGLSAAVADAVPRVCADIVRELDRESGHGPGGPEGRSARDDQDLRPWSAAERSGRVKA